MPFEFGQLSPKAYTSIRSCNARINLWHGAVRSGKTISSLIAWGLRLSIRPKEGLYMMVGKTSKALERNCVLPFMDIFGHANCVHVPSQSRLYFLGRRIDLLDANDSGSAGRIQGSTVTDAYGDELTTWPESVFAMLMSRLSVPGARFYGTTNPDGPSHWLKKNYIDRAPELNLRQWGFGLDDNLALPSEYKEAIRREYTGLWYRRYVLGEWTLAEGAVYDCLGQHNYVEKDDPRLVAAVAQGDRYFAIDYGTANPFVCLDVRLYCGNMVLAGEWRWDSADKRRQMTDSEYADQMMRMAGEGNPVVAAIVDPSAASFILELRRRGLPVRLAENEVLDGIRRTGTLLADARILIDREACSSMVAELEGYRWDAKGAIMGVERPVKHKDHGPDALRYAVSTLCNRINIMPQESMKHAIKIYHA